MDANGNDHRFPSLEEFQGWYNLGYRRPDGIPVLDSYPNVPEFEHGEFFQLYVTENQWFEALVPTDSRKPFDPLAHPQMFVRNSADDRTLEVYPDFDYVTVEVVDRIQREFLGRHPLWRVILMSYDPSCSIVIYPQQVRYGNLPFDMPPTDALARLVPRAVAAWEEHLRPQRAEVAFVQQRLREKIHLDGELIPGVVGVLDNDRGDYSRLAVFLLVPSNDRRSFELEGPDGAAADLLEVGDAYGVEAAGKVISRNEIPDSAKYAVMLYYLPAEYRGPLTISNRESGSSEVFELTTDAITRTRSID